MEYLEGEDLAQVVKARGRAGVEEAVGWVEQACLAIGEAHAAGIVHRDIKPENLFLARRQDGVTLVKVLDFGISKIAEAGVSPDSELRLTSARTALGSPLYMSPEQIRTPRDADERSDVWSLGVVLFELLTGSLPFAGETVSSLTASIVADPPSSLRELRPDVPVGLEGVVVRCLRKAAASRYANAAELGEALAPFGPSADARPTASTERAPASARSRARTVALVLLVASCATIGVVATWPKADGAAPAQRSAELTPSAVPVAAAAGVATAAPSASTAVAPATVETTPATSASARTLPPPRIVAGNGTRAPRASASEEPHGPASAALSAPGGRPSASPSARDPLHDTRLADPN
jgi:serine/threonine-protein kinase